MFKKKTELDSKEKHFCLFKISLILSRMRKDCNDRNEINVRSHICNQCQIVQLAQEIGGEIVTSPADHVRQEKH